MYRSLIFYRLVSILLNLKFSKINIESMISVLLEILTENTEIIDIFVKYSVI